jgi:hypothetical protein
LSKESDIKEKKPSPNSSPNVISTLDNEYNKKIFEEALEQGILDSRSANRFDWLNMGWLKNHFENLDMWDRFSEQDKIIREEASKYNKQDIKDEWDKMDNNPNRLKFGSFVELIKNDDKLKADKIVKDVAALKKKNKKKGHREEDEKEWNDKNPNATFKFMITKKDIDAGIAVFNHLKDRLVCCSGQIFYKHKNILLNDIKIIIPCLIVFVLSLPIFKLLTDDIIAEYEVIHIMPKK